MNNTDAKKRLMEIAVLNTGNYIANLNEEEFAEYLKKLDKFCDSLPSYADVSKISAEDVASLVNKLTVVQELLLLIRAIEPAEECLRLILKLKPDSDDINAEVINFESFEAEIEAYFRNLSELSIDIQMALYNKQNIPEILPDEKEAHEADIHEPDRVFKILAVDDTSFFLERLKLYFADTQYKTTFVNSGHTALRFLKNNVPDLFILDINMPGMDGYELAEKIREHGITKPILFLTSNANRNSVLKAISAGGTDFVVKPCTKEQIIERVEKNLSRYIKEASNALG